MPFVHDFVSVPPRFRKKQEEGLLWLAEAHTQAERFSRPSHAHSEAIEDFRSAIIVALRRFGCNPPRISYRSHELADFNHFNWQEMEIFRLQENAAGEGVEKRTEAFHRGARRAFDAWYDGGTVAPEHLIHVTCTGYLAPSAAQLLVLKKGWQDRTTVTHLYHMGCYAALPALRIASGFCADQAQRVDVAHTEFCTMHLNPSQHEPEHLVMQSLFADGLIRYAVSTQAPEKSLKILALLEDIIPESADDMSWVPYAAGMKMTLSREVPSKIGAVLKKYHERLLEKAGLFPESASQCHYAIHPGGPRIIDQAQDILHLRPEQVELSRAVLAEQGNMSSATLPHVWKLCLESSNVKPGEKIVTFAFGPGLTISGGVFEKMG